MNHLPAQVAYLVLLWFASTAEAAKPAAGFGFTATPSKIFIDSAPGTVESREVILVNDSPFPVTVETYAWDLWYGKGQQIVYGPPGTHAKRSAAPWIKTVPQSLMVGAKSRAAYEINLSTPADARGGHFSVVFAEVKPADSGKKAERNSKTAQFGLRLGTVIYQNTAGHSKETVELKNTQIQPPTRDRPLSIRTRVENTGDTYVQPRLSARVLRADKKTVARITLQLPETESETVLPGQEKPMEGTYSGSIEPGTYTALISCEFGKEGLKTIQVPFTVKKN